MLAGIKSRLQADGIHLTGPKDDSTVATVAAQATGTEGTSSEARDDHGSYSG